MSKKQFIKLLENLPETIDQVNDELDDQDIIMIDFMDGEQVLQINYIGEDQYKLMDEYGCDICTVDKDHILKNRIKQ